MFDSSTQYEGPVMFIAGERSKFFKAEHEDDIMRLFPNAEIRYESKTYLGVP